MGTHHIFSLDTQISTLTFPCQPKTHHVFSCRSLKLRNQAQWRNLTIKCVDGDNELIRPDSKRKDEVTRDDSCDGLMEDDNIEEDVKEKVELMEMEAIMGKDDGKKPMDYKRRAGIFHKSSLVFQANKDQPHHCNKT
ncbi:hypothetical protein QVD17_35795 [Tagetes erecta]|uniref:Uncharacterized protein n=1 Tax=Tagetes erecta TaxID=13708 RepID=A0AAD8JR72_TARER|nr:hypothetical protein QVD17_35795 [Tagetes erecta]